MRSKRSPEQSRCVEHSKPPIKKLANATRCPLPRGRVVEDAFMASANTDQAFQTPFNCGTAAMRLRPGLVLTTGAKVTAVTAGW